MNVTHIIPNQDERQFDTRFCEFANGFTFQRNSYSSDTDFIYAGSISVLDRAVELKKKINKPLACWVWDIPYNWRSWGMDKQGLAANAHRDGVNKGRIELLKNCDLVISASKWTQKVLKKHFNTDSAQLYYYIDTEYLNKVPAQDKVKQVIQISRYYYNKRFEDSIEAMKEFPDYKLILMGTGLKSEYGKKLRKMAGENVVFYDSPNREEVVTQLKKSELLLSPTVFEGWGITPIEAIYCGVPPILSDLEVFKEVYGEAAVYHKRLNIVSLANSIGELIDQKYKQEEYIARCAPLIKEFTPQKFAERWIKLIKEFL